MSAVVSASSGLSLHRPYKIPELARKIDIPTQRLRRWLLRAHLAQPEVQGIMKTSDGWIITSVAKVAEYRGWGAIAKRFVTEDDAQKLQLRVRDQDRQLQSLRARLATAERTIGKLVALVERAGGRRLEDLPS